MLFYGASTAMVISARNCANQSPSCYELRYPSIQQSLNCRSLAGIKISVYDLPTTRPSIWWLGWTKGGLKMEPIQMATNIAIALIYTLQAYLAPFGHNAQRRRYGRHQTPISMKHMNRTFPNWKPFRRNHYRVKETRTRPTFVPVAADRRKSTCS